MKQILIVSILCLFSLNVGCALVTGVGIFGVATYKVMEKKPDYLFGEESDKLMPDAPNEVKLETSYDVGLFGQSHHRYRYDLDDQQGGVITKPVRFSEGEQQTCTISLQRNFYKDKDNYVSFGPVVGQINRQYKVKVSGQTENCSDSINYFGAMIEKEAHGMVFYGKFIYGQGSFDIELLKSIPPFPESELRFQFTRFEVGAGVPVADWLQIRSGISLDSISLGDPEGHINEPLPFFKDNANQTITTLIGIQLQWEF